MAAMRPFTPVCLGLGLVLAVSGCTNPYDPGQRAIGGGLIGAGTGAAIGGLAGGGRGAATGALIGGAVGAVGGVVTTPTPPPVAPPPAYGAYPQAPAPAWYPEMVWLPSPGIYVGVGSSYPLFYYGSSYYYSYNNAWYYGPSYRGPWQPLRAPPPPLRSFRPGDWNAYQARARSHYPADPNWRHFRPR
jgi:hypothetical protein